MEYKKLVSIVGKPGLWEIINQRPDGLIARPVGEGKTQFISSRLNQFTLLENISIYTEDDVETLDVIFQSIIDKEKSLPVPEKNSSGADIKKYFKEILPTYDEEKVYVSDMKKVIKWFNILKDHDIAGILKNKKEEEEKEAKEKEKEGKKAKSEKKEEKKETKGDTKKKEEAKATKAAESKSEKSKEESKAKVKPKKEAPKTKKTAETKPAKEKKTTKKTTAKKTDNK